MLFPSKITLVNVNHAILEAARRHPGQRPVVLHDQPLALTNVEMVNCREALLGGFLYRDFAETVFIYACDSDEIGAPFVEAIIARQGRFLPVFEATPSLYTNANDTARRVLENEYEDQRLGGFAKWDFGPHDFVNLLQAVEATRGLEGDYVEIGCFRGSSGCAVLRYMKAAKIRRRCYFFDVFEGFNYDEAKSSADTYWNGSHKTEGRAVVEERLRRHEAPANGPSVTVVQSNIIQDPLPPEIQRIAVANVDVDMYEAVLASLHRVAPLMVPGGILIVEDPGHTPLLIGARVALNQFLRTPASDGFLPIYMQSGQTFLIKTGQARPGRQER